MTDKQQKIQLRVGKNYFMLLVHSASTASLMPRYMAAAVNENSEQVFRQESDRVQRDYNEHDIQNHGKILDSGG